MIISFSNTPFVLACVCGIFILAAHCVQVFGGRDITRFTTPVSALLHVALAVLLFFAGAEFDLLVACILFSVLVYSLVGYISYIKDKKGDDGK